MADPVLELDAAASNVDGTNPGTAMLLVDASTGWGLGSFEAPSPEPKLLWTSNVDMDGAIRADPGHYENRTVTAQLWCERSTAALTQAQLRILGTKVGKIAREGGTLKVTYPSGNTFIFDLVAGSHNIVFDHAFVLGNLASVTVTFTALPGARGAEQDLGDNTETTLPCLIFTEASIPGDLDALGRLVVDDDSAVSQWWLTWGIQSRYYSSSANASLFYQVEGRTALGGSAADIGTDSPSGGQVLRNSSLTRDYRAMLSTQATGAGAHLSHVGTFRIYTRIRLFTANVGAVTLALEWGQGDYLSPTVNASTTLPITFNGRWLLVDLGLVTLTPTASGTQRWEGRIIAKIDAPADTGGIDIDYLMLVPVDEGSGIVSGVQRSMTPTSYVGEDHFTSTAAAAALNARVAPTGGTWATSGAATDFAFADASTDPNGVSWDEHVSRTASGTRYAILGSTDYSNVAVKIRHGSYHEAGVIARWVDANNHLVGRVETGGVLVIAVVVAGSETELATFQLAESANGLTMFAWASGSVTLQAFNAAGGLIGAVTATHSSLLPGGTLEDGKPGFVNIGDGVIADRYDDFFVWIPPPDAAMFASQSLEIRHDRVSREDSSGALWTTPSSYVGDYLRVPPSGAESRTARLIVKGTRSDPFALDSGIDDISARLYVTPRYLQVPSA